MVRRFSPIATCGPYEQIDVEYDLENRAVWCYLNPRPRPCFNTVLLDELKHFLSWLKCTCLRTNNRTVDPLNVPFHFLVSASRINGVYNLGGDLHLFLECIEARDQDRLARYASACIDVVYSNSSCLEIPFLTTVTVVQGHALGGGFEAAVSSRVLIAEERARFGLPEILFNLIPGMGALSFLSRRLNPGQAKRMILSGDTYTAAELWEMGVVDVLAPDGDGEKVARDYVRRHLRRANAHEALARAISRVGDVTKEELLDIARIWVDAAMSLDRKDLRTMRRLVGSQNRRSAAEEGCLNAAEA